MSETSESAPAHALDKVRFERLWTRLGARDSTAFEVLCRSYTSAGRHYHSSEHIAECLAWFDRVRDMSDDADAVEAAIWFHDAVYEVERSDNEQASVELLYTLGRRASVAASRLDRVASLVLCTKHSADSLGGDAQLLVDIDLSILGSPPARYTRYERDIRREYAAIPWDRYRAGRTRILGSFLERVAIYRTSYFYDRLEHQARENLAEALRGLHAA